MIENFFYSYRYLILASDLTLLLGIVTVAHYRNSSNGIFKFMPFFILQDKAECTQVFLKMRQFGRSGNGNNPRSFL